MNLEKVEMIFLAIWSISGLLIFVGFFWYLLYFSHQRERITQEIEMDWNKLRKLNAVIDEVEILVLEKKIESGRDKLVKFDKKHNILTF
jgi:hypothetical protein